MPGVQPKQHSTTSSPSCPTPGGQEDDLAAELHQDSFIYKISEEPTEPAIQPKDVLKPATQPTDVPRTVEDLRSSTEKEQSGNDKLGNLKGKQPFPRINSEHKKSGVVVHLSPMWAEKAPEAFDFTRNNGLVWNRGVLNKITTQLEQLIQAQHATNDCLANDYPRADCTVP